MLRKAAAITHHVLWIAYPIAYDIAAVCVFLSETCIAYHIARVLRNSDHSYTLHLKTPIRKTKNATATSPPLP